MEAFSKKFCPVLLRFETIKYGDYSSLTTWCREMKTLLLELSTLITSFLDDGINAPRDQVMSVAVYCLAGLESFRGDTEQDTTLVIYNPDDEEEQNRGFPLLDVLVLDKLWYEVKEYIIDYYRGLSKTP